MAAAIIGLVGALLGALTTLLGTALSERRQARREDRKWSRDQRTAAYDGALRHLLRAANLRSEFANGGGAAVLNQEHQREWFDDLVQAQFSLHASIRHCDVAQLAQLTEAVSLLDTHIARLNSSETYDGKGFSMLQVLLTCIDTVTECARRDGGGPQTGFENRPAITTGEGSMVRPQAREEEPQQQRPRDGVRNILMGSAQHVRVVGGTGRITFGAADVSNPRPNSDASQ
ncbi:MULTISPECIES: hypothetical protein [unclassified Streptomyces]|uniref:hypothetical protein n=1 Tax=unclassified Streptomyces TaxID=2593676 RepID=UPI00278C4827|nr:MULTISPECIES: hypothetical protein [unclassified Streptomyces]